MKSTPKILELVDQMNSSGSRYAADAYFFVMESLHLALSKLQKPRHLSGAELLDALLEHALEQYGPMAQTVLKHWGIKNSLDFGVIVFKMVGQGILQKTDNDCLDDFKDPGFFRKLSSSGELCKLIQSETIESV